MTSEQLARFADLVVGTGANVQRGQIVAISTEPGKEEVTRALAESAYRHGAKFVDVSFFDLHVKRARIEYSDEEFLDYVPPWYGERALALGEHRAARVGLTGPSAPGLFSGLDPARVGRDQLPFIKENMQVVNARETNWCAAPCPTPEWAQLIRPELEPAEALERLEADLLHVMRLDEDDPAAMWTRRVADLDVAAGRLNDRRFSALRFRGPGTDLTVGLLPGSTWIGGAMDTVGGIRHIANLPTEEVFTAPDPARVDGHVRSTKPLVIGGTTVEGLRMRFEGGRAVEVEADEGGEVLAELTRRDEGAARLGEVALVDRAGRIGALDTVFYDTLLDENATSHVALGAAYAMSVAEADRERINVSQIHIDFMIGGPDVDVDGITEAGDQVPVLHGGDWRL